MLHISLSTFSGAFTLALDIFGIIETAKRMSLFNIKTEWKSVSEERFSAKGLSF
jgi:hypothetical protein